MQKLRHQRDDALKKIEVLEKNLLRVKKNLKATQTEIHNNKLLKQEKLRATTERNEQLEEEVRKLRKALSSQKNEVER